MACELSSLPMRPQVSFIANKIVYWFWVFFETLILRSSSVSKEPHVEKIAKFAYKINFSTFIKLVHLLILGYKKHHN